MAIGAVEQTQRCAVHRFLLANLEEKYAFFHFHSIP